MLAPARMGRKEIFPFPNDSAYPPRVSALDVPQRPVVVERRDGVNGELVLRRAGRDYEVIANGTFLMDTRDGRSERALVREAVAGMRAARVLLGGLGVGFSLDEALRAPEVGEVAVVELEPVVVGWARTHLRAHGGAGLDDPRVRLVVADLADAIAALEPPFDAICLDVDNGPGWLVHERNRRLYDDPGLAGMRRLLRPGGRLTVWAAAADAAFEARLRARFDSVRSVAVAAPRGPDDVVYVAGLSPSTSP
jgi:spermidine synthase